MPDFKETTSSSVDNSGADNAQGTDQRQGSAPTISLPKGGGAIQSIGEKFATNPVTGTGSMSVPIATSPGRSGFGPQLALSYDSGSGNGVYGFGWNLSLPSITRKTAKGLPRYHDAEESDIFLLSGAEDLVPLLESDGIRFEASVSGYLIHRYRPRIEGLFARIERWARLSDGDVHWRSISKDNILTLYGKDPSSRIADPEDASRVFSWLICETRDDKGNAIQYGYKSEDGVGVDLTQAHESNRGDHNDPRRTANRYLKRIHYGNRTSLLDDAGSRPLFLSEAQIQNAGWMFEVVFDYGEHDTDIPTPKGIKPWVFRDDPFSTYRAGFEVRTTRLCQRVLMFHHFEGEEGVGNDCLVRSTDFTYSHEQDPTSAHNPIYTFLRTFTQTGYKRNGNSYRKRSLPPVEFEYTQPIVQDTVEEVDSESLENIPMGLDGTTYQWTDLHGEGLPGILTEQAEAWYYKRNLAPINEIEEDGTVRIRAKFAPLERVAKQPNLALAGGAQFMDLAGNGQPDLVMLGGPMPGFYEHDVAESWQLFRPFTSYLNRAMHDPNLKFIDLNGDGHADVLITEDEAFVWHSSLAEEGFGPAIRVAQVLDENKGPRIVFADGTQSIYLADLSGDGLTDLVRIRNGEVCYWPNLGYCRFGAKIAMENAPHFDHPDQFDHKRIRLADIDGSGTIDIIYLHRDGVCLYFNQSGNSWGAPQVLRIFPRVDELVSIVPIDLLGNGTACLVWSSPLPNDAGRPMRYVNLMGEQKPHLLIRTVNNLGAETHVQYAPSTKFYLQDKYDGKPWITKLPFPVHVVEKVTVTDKWNKTKFSSTYSYHHGYFDGHEREFRGFGRVEQIDAETYGEFTEGNINSPYITDDHTLYQPPIKTVTWYHTGVMIDRKKILQQFKHEYFPQWLEDGNLDETNVLGTFQEAELPEPDIKQQNLNAEEMREALRSCKGMILRQEVYELDVDAFTRGAHQPIKLYSTAYHNCHIQRLQPRGTNPHAVFLVTESEAITYQYELDLQASTLIPDPRIAHTFNLNTDEYGNVLQAIAIVYPRLGEYQDDTLERQTIQLIQDVQKETHIAYSESHFTNDINTQDNYRLRVPCEALSYEITGISPADEYFTLEELQSFRLNLDYQSTGQVVTDIEYHQLSDRTSPQKRTVEHSKMLYFNDKDSATREFLKEPLPFGEQGNLGLPYETYTLALTDDLLNAILAEKFTPDIQAELENASKSGYLSDAELRARFAGIDTTGQYWIRSGIAGFSNDAADHFFLPKRYINAFNQTTTLNYDPLDLYIKASIDPIGNTVSVEKFDYRVLAPRELKDINDNVTEVIFDVLGLPSATAVKGKGDQADNLTGLTDELLNPDRATQINFFTEPRLAIETISDYQQRQQDEARRLLGNTTARHLYYFGEIEVETGEILADGSKAKIIKWGEHPASACGIVREQHAVQLDTAETSPLQLAFEYSDGNGNVLVTKVQAEPQKEGELLSWIANGKTILNNKGKPVKQYEPYFNEIETAPEVFEPDHRYEEPKEVGVTPIIYYDAAGRVIRTEAPDGSYSRVEFSSWHVSRYDQNDTILEPVNDWYQRMSTGTDAEQRAARIAAKHADTPATTLLDSLGREVINVAFNRSPKESAALANVPFLDRPWLDQHYVTFTKLDAEGKPLWIQDARDNLVMRYTVPASLGSDPTIDYFPAYDIAGNLLFQHSMDGGDRWMINDAAGQPFYAWDENERALGVLEQRVFHTTYDDLRRPLEQSLKIASDEWTVERFVYGEEQSNDKDKNLRGQVYKHYDSSGLMTNVDFDFKGNLLAAKRRLTSAYKERVIHWPESPPSDSFTAETFIQSTKYDALNRMVRLENWHLEDREPAIYTPQYNQRGVLLSETLAVRGQITEAIQEIAYDAKGQRTFIEFGNNTRTSYEYDTQTFRLIKLETVNTITSEKLQDLSYSYDPVGNITEITDAAIEPVFFRNQEVKPRSKYVYDALYRLIEAEGREQYSASGSPSQRPPSAPDVAFPISVADDPNALRDYTQRYQYDSVGNIMQMRHITGVSDGNWTRDYAYAEDSNRLLSTWTGSDRTTAVNYQYDKHGSMLNLNNVPEAFQLHWDTQDMIHDVDLGGGGHAWYNYDANKQRTRKRIERIGGFTEERFYLGGMEFYRRRNAAGEIKEEIETFHLFANEQRVLIVEDVLIADSAELPKGVLFRYQYGNHLGSVALEMNENGASITYEEYHPYGTTAYQARNKDIKAAKKRYRYTGMERDEESGLSYHTARYYLPWLGRWGSSDPIQTDGGVNVYLYSNNSPLLFQDSNGKQAVSSEVASLFRSMMLLRHSRPLIFERFLMQNEVALFRYLQPFGYQGSHEDLNENLVDFDNAMDRAGIFPTPAGPDPNQEILDSLPDGTGFAGSRSEFENATRIQQNERDRRTGQNISGGVFGASGYLIAGDEGSDVGAVIDNGLTRGQVRAQRNRQRVRQAGRSTRTNQLPDVSRQRPSRPARRVRPRPQAEPLNAVQTISRIEGHVIRQNSRLESAIRSGDIRFLQNLGLSQKRIDILMNPSSGVFAANYGIALELAVSRAIRSDSRLSQDVVDTRNQSGTVFPTRSPRRALRPDFGFSAGALQGNIVDLTTPGQASGKLKKYHDRTIVLTYERPTF
ncbi:SpvB/TcaC N-terminal domain-containing protein [uncultured Psychrobacter sp.]|uniref:SpvB/TcaC N-terminal domain-containing protein n=1 Tax=uncultured Psychrobacter sp. TaxID=259303 RepID=UPI0034599E6F